MIDQLHPHPALPLGRPTSRIPLDRPEIARPEFAQAGSASTDQAPEMNIRSRAQRRFVAECAAMAVVALLWLACLVLGVGGARATQAISNFGLIAATGSAGIACLVTARRSLPQHRRMWKLLGASALSWAAARPPGPGTRTTRMSWPACAGSRSWGPPGHRRLRHRLLLAQPPAPLPPRHPQDRPVVRGAAQPRQRQRRAGPHRRPPRPEPPAGHRGRGVQDSAQFLTLRRMGCDIGQGDYFGRPMESEEISRLLGDELAATRPQRTRAAAGEPPAPAEVELVPRPVPD
jgi:hypothetical protein